MFRRLSHPRRYLVPLGDGPWLTDNSCWRLVLTCLVGGVGVGGVTLLLTGAQMLPPTLALLLLVLTVGIIVTNFVAAVALPLAIRSTQICPRCLRSMARSATTCPHCHFHPPQEAA